MKTDHQLKQDVAAELAWDPAIQAGERRRGAAWSAPGVFNVINELRAGG
jgi:hypothetical protein